MLDTCEEPVEVNAERAEGTADSERRALDSHRARLSPAELPSAVRDARPEDQRRTFSRPCEEAAEAGESRVQGDAGAGRGFPKEMVPSARDGDGDDIVCER